ncbi:hypothetical protein HOC_07804 [Hyphomonas oceanitis SCH89]|uniref:Uncharacterized protein n=1 Tax=Hyphomonas oceanitis SCH89 TaxID=1280953 RepID=A0A059G8L1_9PROT|nr:hypothetical protein HOC_07804 [Hyphomonas oceanitis SCH89]
MILHRNLCSRYTSDDDVELLATSIILILECITIKLPDLKGMRQDVFNLFDKYILYLRIIALSPNSQLISRFWKNIELELQYLFGLCRFV